MKDHSVNLDVYCAVLGDRTERAAVHDHTVAFCDFFGVSGNRETDSLEDIWAKYYRRSLERDGFHSVEDCEITCYAESDTLDDFIAVNEIAVSVEKSAPFALVNTDAFRSRQAACASVPDCAGWWQFSRIGYNVDGTQALLHVDHEHPEWGLMGTGHFILMQYQNGLWAVQAEHMTWVS